MVVTPTGRPQLCLMAILSNGHNITEVRYVISVPSLGSPLYTYKRVKKSLTEPSPQPTSLNSVMAGTQKFSRPRISIFQIPFCAGAIESFIPIWKNIETGPTNRISKPSQPKLLATLETLCEVEKLTCAGRQSIRPFSKQWQCHEFGPAES